MRRQICCLRPVLLPVCSCDGHVIGIADCELDRAAGSVEWNGGYSFDIFPLDEPYLDLPAMDLRPRNVGENLEGLRPLVGGTMEFRGTEKARIVGRSEMLHQCRDELLWWQAPD